MRIAVVGTTTSGKTSLAIDIARELGGGIICTDSRTIYKYLSIGVGKPTPGERMRAPHYMLDLLELDQWISGQQFAHRARPFIAQLEGNNKPVIFCGGTELFTNAVTCQMTWQPMQNSERQQVAELDTDELQKLSHQWNIAMPLNHQDRKTLVRSLACNRFSRTLPRDDTLFIGRKFSDTELEARIRVRAKQMIEAGLKEEVEHVCQTHNRTALSINSIGYCEWDERDKDSEVLELIIERAIGYAQKQALWLDRLPVHWVQDSGEALDTIHSAN